VAVVRQVFDTAALNAQLHGPNGGVARDLLRRALRVQTEARKRAPADTGRLRGSIELATVQRTVFGVATVGMLVGSNLDYARMVHDGTGEFGPRGTPIVPTQKKFLVFRSRKTGKVVVAKSVRGQRGVAFLKDALWAVRG
jgi:hypothetical protein